MFLPAAPQPTHIMEHMTELLAVLDKVAAEC